MSSGWQLYAYDKYILDQMNERKKGRTDINVDMLLSINALPIPCSLKHQFIISYKYDKLEVKYKRQYKIVLHQLLKKSRCRLQRKAAHPHLVPVLVHSSAYSSHSQNLYTKTPTALPLYAHDSF